MLTCEEFEKLEGWFWWEEAVAMSEAIDNIKDLNGVIFEAGSYMGKSTALIASCTNSKIYAVDPFSWGGGTYEKFKEQTKGYENITPIIASAVDYKENFNEPIKLLFIDCDHTYGLTKKIYELYEPLVVDRGIILFHDCSNVNYDLSGFSDEESNQTIPNDMQGGWIGPTQVLQEVRKTNKTWIYGDRSLHGIMIRR